MAKQRLKAKRESCYFWKGSIMVVVIQSIFWTGVLLISAGIIRGGIVLVEVLLKDKAYGVLVIIIGALFLLIAYSLALVFISPVGR